MIVLGNTLRWSAVTVSIASNEGIERVRQEGGRLPPASAKAWPPKAETAEKQRTV
jgi:hypothetical protein